MQPRLASKLMILLLNAGLQMNGPYLAIHAIFKVPVSINKNLRDVGFVFGNIEISVLGKTNNGDH
jgi:hypothetical protein